MERLTKYSNDIIRNKAINILRKLDSENGLDGDELAIISSFCLIERMENKELKKYEDLEEENKLLKLPCAVGDTIYTIYSDKDGSFIEEAKVEEVSTHRVWIDSACFGYDDFGKTVFLTREEAEAALKAAE